LLEQNLTNRAVISGYAYHFTGSILAGRNALILGRSISREIPFTAGVIVRDR